MTATQESGSFSIEHGFLRGVDLGHEGLRGLFHLIQLRLLDLHHFPNGVHAFGGPHGFGLVGFFHGFAHAVALLLARLRQVLDVFGDSIPSGALRDGKFNRM